MQLYKITDENGRTRAGFDNETQWGENITRKAEGKGQELCTDKVIHAYTDPYLAVFFNPIGGDYNTKTMQLWEAKGRVVVKASDKVGCKQLTTIKKIPIPILTIEQRAEIAIRCAVLVYKETSFLKWANEWLDGTDRSGAAAGAAAGAAGAAAGAAGAAEAAGAAAGAAEAAAWAAAGAAAGAAARAAWAAEAAWAARAPAWAAEAAGAAVDADPNLNIIAIIRQVVEKEG
ncbi:hypothetical protein LCGC14_2497050 [marine sediment metagenome]|uniref:Uncharacterized protein n=1 Tax=marine sediment metagenome TaxID=412755 RepID=A0A0F9B3U7_9ZZZZ